jgi:hypothetical protein
VVSRKKSFEADDVMFCQLAHTSLFESWRQAAVLIILILLLVHLWRNLLVLLLSSQIYSLSLCIYEVTERDERH